MTETAHQADDKKNTNELERQLNDFIRIRNSLKKVLGYVDHLETSFIKNKK